MADVGGGYGPVTDLARRLQRVEDKLDERIATVDMVRSLEAGVHDRLAAVEKLFEAKLVGQQVSVADIEKRTNKIEGAQSKFVFALLGAFLLLLVQFVVLAATATGGSGP